MAKNRRKSILETNGMAASNRGGRSLREQVHTKVFKTSAYTKFYFAAEFGLFMQNFITSPNPFLSKKVESR